MIKRFLLKHIIPLLVRFLLRMIYYTTRKKIYGLEELIDTIKHKKGVFATWHGDLASEIFFFKKHIYKYGDVCVLVSPSDDGQMLGNVIKGLGGKIKTGDSRKRPTAALVSMVRAVTKENCFSVFACDGPLGPAHIAKKGVISCSYLAKAPVFAIASSAKRAIRFKKAWDNFFLPLPFTKVVISMSKSFYPDKDIDASLSKLQKIMQDLKKRCDFECGIGK